MEDFQDKIFKDESIDIKKYLFKIIFNWYWFAISIFFAVSIAYLVNRYTEPIFRVSSSLIVRDDERSKGLTGAENIIQGMEMFMSKKNVQNEIGMLKSYNLAHRTLKELKDFEITYVAIGRRGFKEAKLYRFCPFYVEYDTNSPQLRGYPIIVNIISEEEYILELNNQYNLKKRLRFGEVFQNDFLNIKVSLRDPGHYSFEPRASNKYYFIINSLNGLTNSNRGKLIVEVNDKKGSILTLTTTGFVPQQLVDYLNKLMEIYIRMGLEEKNQIAINTINFIDSQLKEIVDSLKYAESRLQNFRMTHRLVDISQEGTMIVQKIEALESEKALLDIKESYYNYMLDYISNSSEIDNILTPSLLGVEDPVLTSLVNKLGELYSQEAVFKFSAEKEIPSLRLIQEQIEDTKQAIKENIINNLKTISISKKNLSGRISVTEEDLRKLPATERQLIDIERTFQLNNDIYTYLLQKRAEAGIAKASNIPDNKILDWARAENSAMIKPKKSMNYMMAMAIGFIIPLLMIFFIEFFKNKIIDKADIERQTKAPILGAIGHNSYRTDLPVFENPKSSLAETFRALRTNLQFMASDKKNLVISISSSLTGEGKTFCALNLASILAMAEKKVLLVGLDLRKPKIHRVFNLDNELGLSTYLIGQTAIEDIIFPTEINNLSVAPSGPIPPNPAELIGLKRLTSFFEQVRKDFDFIVLDTPPIAIVTDALLVNKFSDINIFVIRQNFTTRSILPLIEDLYSKGEIHNLSLIINDIKPGGYYSYAYGYGYGYSYSYNYGYRYGKGYYTDENGEKGLFGRIKNNIARIF